MEPVPVSRARPQPSLARAARLGRRASDALLAGTLAVLASRPATRPALALFEFLLSPANAALSRRFLLRVFDPADEFVPRQRRDVHPGSEGGGAREQRFTQIFGDIVHHAARYALARHARNLEHTGNRRQAPRRASPAPAPPLSQASHLGQVTLEPRGALA